MDLLGYFKGDGRPWGVTTNWAGDSQMQSQSGQLSGQFFLVKGMFGSACPWEEFRFDDNFIYRGFDISPADGTFYSLADTGLPASAWANRNMQVGDWFSRDPMITFYNADASIRLKSAQQTWLLFANHYDHWTSGRGYSVPDVIELRAFDGDQGRASGVPFETYFYAMNVGMVGWRGTINGAPAQMDVNFIWASANVPGAPSLARKSLPGSLAFTAMPGVIPAPPPPPPNPVVTPPPPPPAPVGTQYIIRPDIAVANIRQQPTTRSQVIGQLTRGMTINVVNTVLGQDGDGFHWFQRDTGGYIRTSARIYLSAMSRRPRHRPCSRSPSAAIRLRRAIRA